MKAIYYKRLLFLPVLLVSLLSVSISHGQAVDNIDIKVVGKASYGDGTPFNLALTTWGSDNNWKLYDQLRALHGLWPQKWKLGVADTNTRSIPTNNYWSGLIFQENNKWGGQNWFYPGVVEFKQTGSEVWFPNKWNDVGASMDAAWGIVVEPQDKRTLVPTRCIASDWGDWIVETKLTDATNSLTSTFVQGMPYVWFESSFDNPTLKIHDAPYTTNGTTPITTWPYVGDAFVGTTSGRQFAVFLPPNTTVRKDGSNFTLDFSGNDSYFVIGFLNNPSEFTLLKQYAYRKPTKTTVDWAYNPQAAKVDVSWNIEAKNLLGGTQKEVLQGFLPHHYMHSLATPSFINMEYLTAKGMSKYAVGNKFDFSYRFTGVVPHISAPTKLNNTNPFDSTYLAKKIEDATKRGAMGQDIYWGLKPLDRQAKYFAMAKETNHPGADKLKQVCKAAFDDWFTYTPGETEHCFYRYDDNSNLDALVGFDPGGYSATFTDHDMCYGYMFYAAAVYAMYDPSFLTDYGDFLVLLSKQINNWDRNDKDYPFFRLFEPWTGHNWAGGTGGGGNNVESLSEGMQSWAGMFLLGEMLGNKEMRDAAAFGYVSMSRCFDQYYRDRDGINFSDKFTADVAAMLWTSGPAYGNYVGNEANYWMNWISYSPAMNYMFSDPAAARQQYDSFQNLYAKNSGQWGDDFWNNLNMYIQGFDSELASTHRANNYADFQNNDLNGISYYYLHSNRFLGDIDWTRHCSEPLSQVYYNKALKQYTYVCYNPTAVEKVVTAYNGTTVIGTFKVPPYKLIQTHLDAKLSGVKVEAVDNIVLPNEVLTLTASGIDQYGASIALGSSVSWQIVRGSGSIAQNGVYTAGTIKDDSVVVKATSGSFSSNYVIKVGEPRRPEVITITPGFTRVPKNGVVYFKANITDQYGAPFTAEVEWTVSGGGSIYTEMGLFQSNGTLGTFIVKAKVGEIAYQSTVVVYEPTVLTDNLALNRPSTASSKQARAKEGNDGNNGSMWQSNSVQEDGNKLSAHWWSVELANVYDIYSVEISWDVSATAYTIQYSLNGTTWLTADSITGSNWWTTDEVDLYAKGISAKYLRVYCYLHDGDYGYAIKEFKAFGKLTTPPTALTTLLMNPNSVQNLQDGNTFQFTVKGYDKDGKVVAPNGQWSVTGGGTITQAGLFTANKVGGPYEVKYTQGTVVATASVKVIPAVISGGFEAEEVRFSIAVVPNPASEEIRILHDNSFQIAAFSIANNQGKTVLSGTYRNVLNISELPSGIYVVKVKTTEGELITQKIIVQ